MVSVLGVEAGIVDEVDAATDHVPRGEGGPVRLPRARRAERVPVVAVVAVRVLVPTCARRSTISLLFVGVSSLIADTENRLQVSNLMKDFRFRNWTIRAL